MAILTRVTRKEYPGAIVEIRSPFACTNFPTIQALATNLQNTSQPTTIVHGKIFTEESAADITTACEI